MPEQEKNYYQKADDDAKYMVEHFADQIVEKLIEEGEASDDLNNDYSGGDSYHHERHVDRAYSLLEAATLLDELDDFEETDSGLWEGQSPRDAIGTQAAFTYGHAVYSMWNDYIKEINSEAREILDEFAEKKEELETKISKLEGDEGTEDWTEEKARALRAAQSGLEQVGHRLKKTLERMVLATVGMEPRRPQGPREWSPRE